MTAGPQLYEVHDRGKPIDFVGTLLGQATSFSSGKPRWFEVAIYKSQGGKYIVNGIGRSLIVHRPSCRLLRDRSIDPCPAGERAVECDGCFPDLARGELVVPEVDREWAQVSDAAEAVIERLRLRDNDGVFYLPRTSLTALEQVAQLDEEMREALVQPQHVA
jgi:hypothetical protein